MSDNVLTILIICITVVIVLIIFRNKLKSISFKREGPTIEAKMETETPKPSGVYPKEERGSNNATNSTSFMGNTIIGTGNKMGVDSSIKLK